MRLMQTLTEVGTIKVSGTLELQKSRDRSRNYLLTSETEQLAEQRRKADFFKKNSLADQVDGADWLRDRARAEPKILSGSDVQQMRENRTRQKHKQTQRQEYSQRSG